MNLRRFFLYMLIGSVSLSAVIGIGVILFGDFGEIEIRVLMTTLTVTATSILGLACGAYLESGRGKYLPLAGIVLAVISALMSLLVIWNVLDDSKPFAKSFLTATLLAVACSHLSLLLLARLDRRFSWTRVAAVVCVALLCAILLFIMWFEPEGGSGTIYRVLGVLGILLASITVITPMLHKLSSAGASVGALDKEIKELESRLADLRDQKNAIENSQEDTV